MASPCPQDAIAALGETTVIGAAVLVYTIAVIAVLVVGIFRLHVASDSAVTTTGEGAVVQAIVTIISVAISAGFPRLLHAIAALGRLAFMAGIGRILIAIVTALTGTRHAITTDI